MSTAMEPTVEDAVSERLMLPMRDGVRLHTVVTRPAEGRRPVMLVRNPYGVDAVGDGVLTWVHPESRAGLLRAGWAVVEQDTRGRYGSAGVDLAFPSDVDDAYDTLAWCAERPWSTGRVAMGCASGLGVTQYMAALSRHPALVAISPTVAALDPHTGFVMEGGALLWAFVLHWAAQQGVNGGHFDDEGSRVHRTTLEQYNEIRLRVPATLELRRHSRFFDAWLRDDAEYWKPITAALTQPPPPVACFTTTGWYDIFAQGALQGYRWLRDGGAPQRLVVGPWSHGSIYGRQVGEVDFGETAPGPDVKTEMHEFLHALGRGEQPASGARVFLMGDDRWVDLPEWPPPSRPMQLWLGAAGTLSSRPGRRGCEPLPYDPGNPVPTHGGRTLLLAEGPHDQREVEGRDDVLVYTGEPLDSDATVMGAVVAELHISTTARSADLAVALVDVHPDGRALNVVDSLRRVPTTPGQMQRVRVDLGSTAMTFKAGHRIRVHIAASNFPRFDRNASTGEPPSVALRLLPAQHTVHHGRGTPSHISLPTLP